MTKNKGITLLEIIIGISILLMILALTIPSLSSFRNRQISKSVSEDIASLVNEARMMTLSSKNSTYYSIHFETNKVVLFTGGVYNSSNSSNQELDIPSPAYISSINLNGNGSNLSFTRLTGGTDQYGTIILQISVDASLQKVIKINGLGVVSIN
jgi:type II secretory pathway pseudopilin PulG